MVLHPTHLSALCVSAERVDISQGGFGRWGDKLAVPGAACMPQPTDPLTFAVSVGGAVVVTDLRKSPLAPDVPSFHPRGGLAPGEKGVRTAILTPPGDRSSRTPSCSLKGEGSPQEDAPRDAPAGLGWGNQQMCRNQAGAQAAPWRRRSSPPPNSAVRKDQLAGARRPEHPGTDLERRPAGALFRPAAPLGH